MAKGKKKDATFKFFFDTNSKSLGLKKKKPFGGQDQSHEAKAARQKARDAEKSQEAKDKERRASRNRR